MWWLLAISFGLSVSIALVVFGAISIQGEDDKTNISSAVSRPR
jgi:hypothetical protein